MGVVVSVSKAAGHVFSKKTAESIYLVEGEGVEGDAHRGVTVQHRSRVRQDPTQPNLRQVHLIHVELIEALNGQGFHVYPGAMGENITTRGIDLLGLPRDTILRIGPEAVVRVTGLRNPCVQLDNFEKGLMSAVLDRDEAGNLIRKAGVMAVVEKSGLVSVGDEILVEIGEGVRRPLEKV